MSRGFGPARIAYCEGNVDGTVGGSYYSLLYLIEGLDRAQYEPIVVFHREHALLGRFASAASAVHVIDRPRPFNIPGVKSASPPFLRHALGLVQNAVNLLRLLGTAARLGLFLKRNRVRLLHLNNSVTRNHDWMLAAWLSRTPCVTHERGINSNFPFLARLFAPRLAAVICISDAVRRNLADYRIGRNNLHVVRNGLDPSRVLASRSPEQVRCDYGIPEGRRVVGMIGNIRQWKGQETLIRALPSLVRFVPNAHCVLVGGATEGDRDYAARLNGLIAELGLRERVTFTGYCGNVADVLNVMEIAVHASVAPEPFGRVILEAMAMRKPVVASRAGAVPEIVIDGVTGYLFAPGDWAELAEKIGRLLEDPARARALGEAGYKRLLAQFHLSKNVQGTMRIYSEVLAS